MLAGGGGGDRGRFMEAGDGCMGPIWPPVTDTAGVIGISAQ